MFSFLSQRIKIKKIKIALFVFSSLFALSLAFFSFADTQTTSSMNIFQDTDQDGLSNEEEKLYGTNPNNPDTDGDGYSDGAEVKSGYDPLKKAPGDKLTTTTDLESQNDVKNSSTQDASATTTVPKKVNLTEEVSKQVAMTLKDSATNQKTLSLDDLRTTIQNTMSQQITVDTLPDIDVSKIKILKQNYSNLSDADRTEKIKKDTLDYVTATSYILVNNSPISMQSDGDIAQLASFVTDNSTSVLSGKNPAMLNDFAKKGDLITEQLQSMTVPENMLDMHKKALRLAQYAGTFKDSLQSNGDTDPLSQINSLAKIQGFIGLFSNFATNVQSTLDKIGIQGLPI
jgi:hypothetical protein